MANFNAGAIEATLELDRSPFQRGIELARRQGREFAQQRYTATLDVDTAGLMAQIAALKAQLDALDGRRVQPHIDVDTAALMAQIALLQGQLDRLDSTRVDVDTSSMTRGFGMAGMGMGNLIALGLALGPALIPGITGATAALGGLVSMLGVAGGGLAALGAGLIGNVVRVIGAQKDLTAAQSASTAAAAAQASAQDQVKAALQGVGDAERNLAAARRNAAYSVTAAEGQLADAQQAARRAQADLNAARQDAVQRLEDMRDQLRGAALDEEGSELAVREARLRLRRVMEDPASTMLERQEAQLAYQRALYNMDQARKRHDDLQESVKKAQKAGVDGDSQVVAARQRVKDANDRVREAETALERARADGARQVADAQRSLARAHEQVAKAQEAAAAASTAAAVADEKLAAVMGKMDGPAAAFVTALGIAKTAWGDFLDATAGGTVGRNGIATRFLNLFSTYLPMFAPVANAAARAIGRLLDSFDQWAANGGMQGIADFLEKWGPPIIEGLGRAFGNLAIGLGGVVKAFAPFARQMLSGAFERFARWGQQLDKSEGFKGFMQFVQRTGPQFLDTLGAAWDALLNIGRALAPAAMPLLKTLEGALRFIADMDPHVLGLVAGGLAAIVGAVMVGTGAAPIVGTLLTLVGLTEGIATLREESDAFRHSTDLMGEAVSDAWEWIKKRWDEAWTRTLKPQLEDMREVIEEEVLPAWDKFWPTVRPIAKFLGKTLADDAENGLGATLKIITGFLEQLAGAMNLWTGIMTGDWATFHKGLEQQSRATGTILEGIWSRTIMGRIAKAVGIGVDDIGRAFADIGNVILAPINGTITHVINPFIGMLNTVAKRLGRDSNVIDPFGTVAFVYDAYAPLKKAPGGRSARDKNTLDARAAGGAVLPGFTPGQDVHHFTSPTGGNLHLSGGEAIMVPEFTRMHGGPRGIDALNKAARAAARYGTKAGGRFADGGIPAVGTWSQHTSGYPWARWAGDINVPGSSDYGNPVRAWKDGIVAAVTYLGDRSYGRYIRINHPASNEQSLYAHLSAANVIGGQAVKRGQMIGRVGDLGNASGPHLHFEVKGGTGLVSTGSSGDGPTGAGHGWNPLKLVPGIKDAIGRLHDIATGANLPGGAGFAQALIRGTFGTMRGMVTDWIKGQIPGASMLFDNGGKLMPGYTNVLNATGEPEAILTGDQWRMARQAITEQAGSKDGWTPELIRELIDAVRAADPIVVPASDDTRELVDAIGFELRVQKRGGVNE